MTEIYGTLPVWVIAFGSWLAGFALVILFWIVSAIITLRR